MKIRIEPVIFLVKMYSLPNQDLFINDLALASTLLHEMAHSTGHKERLDRDLTGEFGSPNYAREELRAEISSMFYKIN